jgi:hypothetical protein
MDAWLLWFASFWTWLFDLVPWIQARANDTESWANQASQSATTAGLTANASMWNPSTNYALGQNAISPTNFQTYRRRVAGVSATDPVSDATNWAAVAAVPDESVTAAKLANGLFACRAWVNFNGTGTVAIRASGNVSSITDQGTGAFVINFTTAMPDSAYAAVGTAVNSENFFTGITSSIPTQLSGCEIRVTTDAGSLNDPNFCSYAFFR